MSINLNNRNPYLYINVLIFIYIILGVTLAIVAVGLFRNNEQAKDHTTLINVVSEQRAEIDSLQSQLNDAREIEYSMTQKHTEMVETITQLNREITSKNITIQNLNEELNELYD